jgi:hypothetical protein
MIAKHQHALRDLKWIHLAAGLQDEYALQLGHRQISTKLTALNIDHVIEEYPGKHGGHHWRFVERIGRMLKCMHAR